MGVFQDACELTGMPSSEYMRTVWRATRHGEDLAAMQVMSALDPYDSLHSRLSASIVNCDDQDGRDQAMADLFQAVTSGRADADELRAAFALGGWRAVRGLLEAQGSAHDRTRSP